VLGDRTNQDFYELVSFTCDGNPAERNLLDGDSETDINDILYSKTSLLFNRYPAPLSVNGCERMIYSSSCWLFAMKTSTQDTSCRCEKIRPQEIEWRR
jgi:hypothetical protein